MGRLALVLGILALFSGGCRNSQVPTGVLVQKRQPVAVLFEVSGTVRVKPAMQAWWMPVAKGRELFLGDKVFTGSDASVRIEYVQEGASLNMMANSLFTIAAKPPSFTRFRRDFGVERGKQAAAKKKPRHALVQNISAAEVAKIRAAGGMEALADGLQLTRDTEEIRVLFPPVESHVFAATFPTTLQLRLEKRWSGVGLWAMLWDKKSLGEPVWSAFGKGESLSISLPRAGRYVLQVISDDEGFSTRPLNIDVVRRKGWFPAVEDVLAANRSYGVIVQ